MNSSNFSKGDILAAANRDLTAGLHYITQLTQSFHRHIEIA